MKKITKLTKNPITWILCALAIIVGVVLWVFKLGSESITDSLKD